MLLKYNNLFILLFWTIFMSNLDTVKIITEVRRKTEQRRRECQALGKHKQEIIQKVQGIKELCFCAHCYTHYSRYLSQ